MPGTGKTATVRSVLRNFQHGETRVEDPEFKFKFCEVNGLKLAHPSRAFSVFWKQLSGEEVGAESAKRKLGAFFRTTAKERGPRKSLVVLRFIDLFRICGTSFG